MLYTGSKLLVMVLPLLVEPADWNTECPLRPVGSTPPANSKVRCTASGGCRVTCNRGYIFPLGERQIFYKCQDGTWHLEGGDPKYYKECVPFCKPACMNGGHCIAPHTCQCPEGWHGRACRRAPIGTASCSPECENGGFCIMNNTCECLEGYTGHTCHHDEYFEKNEDSRHTTDGHRGADLGYNKSTYEVDNENPSSDRLDATESIDYEEINASTQRGCSCSVPWPAQTTIMVLLIFLMK